VLAPDERSFPDQDSSPALASTSLERSWSSTALRYQRGAALFELRFEHRDFAEILVARGLADAESDSTSVSRLTHFRIAWEHQLDAEWRTRVLTSRVRYDHDLDEFRHRRHDTMFGLFVERALGWGNWVDVGYLGTAFDWHTDPPGGPYEDDRDGFASKVSLGWTLEVEGRGWLRALLSHEPDPQQFGGASVMAQVLF
jgi:hypothetical protein